MSKFWLSQTNDAHEVQGIDSAVGYDDLETAINAIDNTFAAIFEVTKLEENVVYPYDEIRFFLNGEPCLIDDISEYLNKMSNPQ